MPWIDDAFATLASIDALGYTGADTAAAEPTALTSLASLAHGDVALARRCALWMSQRQQPDGSVNVRGSNEGPGWTTSLAVLTWSRFTADDRSFLRSMQRGVTWLLSRQGETQSQHADVGHDVSLTAWPWVEGTHSWVEPTAFTVLALKAAGLGDHPRTRQAIKLLLDRQLSTGGFNYGNTTVLGQELRPHVQPSGIAMLALAGADDQQSTLQPTLSYLREATDQHTTTASLCWSLLAQAAWHSDHPDANELLEKSYERVAIRNGSPHRLALLALASTRHAGPFTSCAISATEQVEASR